MLYVNISTQKIEGIMGIRRKYPDTVISVGDDLESLGYKNLIKSPIPEQEGYHAVADGHIDYVQVWRLVETPAEIDVADEIPAVVH
jgi:hypothetical protein